MAAKTNYWRTVAFAPAPPGLELWRLKAHDDLPSVTVRVVGWLTQEQVDHKGRRAGVATIRVIAGVLRPVADGAVAAGLEDGDGCLAAEVIAADDIGWRAHWTAP
ncbi:MAG TPA: hypothetical protein VGH53_30910 [Streptosporangiaceae bacterium]|jgi:hypothetical protein